MFTALRYPKGSMTFIDRSIINPEVKRDLADAISNDMAGNLKQSFNDNNSMSADFQRFTNRSDEDIVKLIKDKDSEATKKNTKQALDLSKEFCLAKRSWKCWRNLFWKSEREKLNSVLKSFYANVRKKDGSLYSKNSLTSLRYDLR